MIFPSGFKYIGDTTRHKGNKIAHGEGILSRPNGKPQYEGHWWLGKMSGRGTFYWENSDSWTGNFQRDELYGLGR